MIDPATRRLVRSRAEERCEYCRMGQENEPFYRYQVEHIIPRQHGGTDDESNLALSCPNCNRHKGPNLTGIDPDTGSIVELFHPRKQEWTDHFEFQGPYVLGKTPNGRTTVRVLAMNGRWRVELRRSVLRGG